jgi:hypothetical protein
METQNELCGMLSAWKGFIQPVLVGIVAIERELFMLTRTFTVSTL